LRVTITTSGSRGDVQPYVAFGLGLEAGGHDVTVAAPAAFESLIRGRGLGFEPVQSDPRRVTERMLEQGGGLLNFARNAGAALRPVFVEMLRAYQRACEDSDAVVYTPIGFFGYPGWALASSRSSLARAAFRARSSRRCPVGWPGAAGRQRLACTTARATSPPSRLCGRRYENPSTKRLRRRGWLPPIPCPAHSPR
jgi:hypothetical protein